MNFLKIRKHIYHKNQSSRKHGEATAYCHRKSNAFLADSKKVHAEQNERCADIVKPKMDFAQFRIPRSWKNNVNNTKKATGCPAKQIDVRMHMSIVEVVGNAHEYAQKNPDKQINSCYFDKSCTHFNPDSFHIKRNAVQVVPAKENRRCWSWLAGRKVTSFRMNLLEK